MGIKRTPKRVEVSNEQAIADAQALVSEQVKTKQPEKDEFGRTLQDRHEIRRGWYLAEASRQAANRELMAKCESFYDSEQIKHEEAEELRKRGQNPVVYNEIFYVINWLIGTERRNRIDFYVVADGGEPEDEEDAVVKTKLLKYLDDVNKAAFERSYAAEEAFKAGLGWLEVGLRGDKSDVPIYIGAESWRNILWDSHARKRDLSDARYLFRIKILDLDVAIAMFPDKEEQLRAAVQTGDQLSMFNGWTGANHVTGGPDSMTRMDGQDDFNSINVVDLFNPRERVMLLECWSREPVKRKSSTDSMGDPTTFRTRVSIMTELDTLIEDWSPYKHDRFPFIPVWGYRNSRTGLPYSPARPLLGPQEALNHRMSKSIWEASSNRMEIEASAIDEEVMDLEELRQEWNAPDGAAVYAAGAISGGKVRQMANPGAAEKQIMLAERDIQTIRHMSGINAAAQGLKSNLNSGIALQTNNENTSLLTSELFDNLLMARQIEGDLTLSTAEQFIVQPMAVRVAGERGATDRVQINQPQPDGTYLNDITARRAHFVVGEQAWKNSYAESAFTQLMTMMSNMAAAAPQVVVSLLDLLFEMHPNLPLKKQILQRIRQVNGQSDPDGKMTPEQQAEQQQKAMIAKAQFEAQMAQLQATIREAQAKGEKLSAEAMAKRLETLYTAAQAAQVLTMAPQIAPVADELARSVGFKDEAGDAALGGPVPIQQSQPVPPLQQADGAMAGAQAGIESPAVSGVNPALAQ